MYALAECGRHFHEVGCLCDVVVTDPAPIRFSPTEVLGSEFLNKRDEWGVPWTPAAICDYTEALLAAYDQWAKERLPVNRRGLPAAELRVEVERLLAEGESMVDIPAILGIEFDVLLRRVLGASVAFYHKWGDVEWLAFETALESQGRGPINLTQIATDMGYPRKTSTTGLRRLVLLYGRSPMTLAEKHALQRGTMFGVQE